MIGDGQNNLGFLYTDRLVELARSDAGQVQPVDANDVFGADQDLSALLPPQMHDGQAVLSVALSTNDAQNGLQDEILNYILTRAGVAQENVAPFRADIESIIMGKGNIFEKMFLNIKNQLAQIQAREAQKLPNNRLSDDAMMREARDKALEALAQDHFNSLGVYHSQDSKYYFAENDLTKGLSNNFLSNLYSNPVLATQMLAAQNDKTVGQAQAMKEELIRLLPRAYYAESSFTQKNQDGKYFHDLALVADDFDLFMASPSIMDIANGTRKPEAMPSKPRASSVRTIQAGIEDATTRLEKLKIREDSKGQREHLIEKLSFAEHYLLGFLRKNGYKFESDANLNTVETIFLTCQKTREFAANIAKEKALAKPELEARIKKINEDIKARKNILREEFNKANQLVVNKFVPIKATEREDLNKEELKALNESLSKRNKELNAEQNKKHFERLEEYYNQDKECTALIAQREAAANQLASFDVLLEEVKVNLAVYKESFIKAYYPEVIPAAKALKNTYQDYCNEQAQIKAFVAKGGTYSCLSFIPVRIKGKQGAQDRLECLVAMSGAEIESANSINAHKILEDFSRRSPEFNGFTYRYVGASPVIDLLLKQVGKGLTGTTNPIAPPRTVVEKDGTVIEQGPDLSQVMPFYDKACAEKRLVSELIKLYKEHGDDVVVLGCDNIALPKANDLARQAELNPQPTVNDAKAKEAAKQKKQPAVAKVSPMFRFAAIVEEKGASKEVVLEGEHIICCSSCQAQKPAVFTALFDAKQQHVKAQAREAAKIANSVNPVEMTDKNRQGVLVIN